MVNSTDENFHMFLIYLATRDIPELSRYTHRNWMKLVPANDQVVNMTRSKPIQNWGEDQVLWSYSYGTVPVASYFQPHLQNVEPQ